MGPESRGRAEFFQPRACGCHPYTWVAAVASSGLVRFTQFHVYPPPGRTDLAQGGPAAVPIIQNRASGAQLSRKPWVPVQYDGPPSVSRKLHPRLFALLGRTVSDRYRVIAATGSGGMGTVFRALHVGLKQLVALKVIDPDLATDRQATARFDREARGASRLDHPNCIRVTDYGVTDDGLRYLVMPFLEGHELGAWQGHALELPVVLAIMGQIFAALDHAHEQGVVHRDLKPENVLVIREADGTFQCKLLDFGIARIVRDALSRDNITTAGTVVGTPEYMSPEQAFGTDPDARTDLYSAGVIFFELLTGRLPFDHPDPAVIMRHHVSSPPPALPERIPQDVAAMVQRLMAKERDDRYSSAAEVMRRIEDMTARYSP